MIKFKLYKINFQGLRYMLLDLNHRVEQILRRGFLRLLGLLISYLEAVQEQVSNHLSKILPE